MCEHLRDRSLVLVLDNLEQLGRETQPVAAILSAAPRVRVLATSRTPLRLSAEHEYPVPPLPVPAEAHDRFEDVVANDAVRLFAARARAAEPVVHADGREPRQRRRRLPPPRRSPARARAGRDLDQGALPGRDRAPAGSRARPARRGSARSTAAAADAACDARLELSTCSTRASRGCSPSWPSSQAAGRLPMRRRWSPATSSRAWRHSSTTVSCDGATDASPCSRRFASTPASGSPSRTSPISGGATPSTSSRSPSTPETEFWPAASRGGCRLRAPGRGRREPAGGALVDGRDARMSSSRCGSPPRALVLARPRPARRGNPRLRAHCGRERKAADRPRSCAVRRRDVQRATRRARACDTAARDGSRVVRRARR